MANQQIWDYANKIGAKMLLVLGVVTLVLGVFLVLVLPSMSIFLTIVLILTGLGVGMYWCETKLNRHFDKNGKPKE